MLKIVCFKLFLTLSILAALFTVVVAFLAVSPYQILASSVITLFLLLFTVLFFVGSVNELPKNSPTQFLNFSAEKAQAKETDNNYYICFEKEDSCWICRSDDENFVWDLENHPFEKQYLCAFVVRSLRYSLISNKKAFHHLFKLRYRIPAYANKNLYVDFKYKGCSKRIQVVKNGISKQGLIAQEISSAIYIDLTIHRAIRRELGSYFFSDLDKRISVNEESYLRWREDKKARKYMCECPQCHHRGYDVSKVAANEEKIEAKTYYFLQKHYKGICFYKNGTCEYCCGKRKNKR